MKQLWRCKGLDTLDCSYQTVPHESQEAELSPTHPELNPSVTREATIVKETEFRKLLNDLSSTLSSAHLST